ncbi:MAG: tryptophan synthase subunit alpha [Lachnospiraceae bacterium]|nr:tryptophan synthase subunit alpha [Lachnospiraceae bacterium]
MNKIEQAFKNKKAFIPFVTCGYPDIDSTYNIVMAAYENGADIIELGIPFSDPTAEGPTIQGANYQALKNNITTDDVFDLVVRLREKIDIPLVFMTYANVVFSYGIERFSKKCEEVGIDGVILPDIPYEEKDEFDNVMSKYNVALISLIAPTSENRIAMIAKEAKGFIYLVSSLGVTGVRSEITTDISKMVELIKENSSIPVAVGFGISTPEQAKKMACSSDGVIVGSAIIKLITEHGKNAAKYVGQYVKTMKDAIS